MGLRSVLDNHRIVVCIGSGGVGKTTTAAALALDAALNGRRVLCLTIDPARRLANSLGLTEMTSSEQRVETALFTRHGLKPQGSLSAMMLDAKRTFDELVIQYASSAAARDQILNNRLYQYVSASLAGTQEYMAMEKLHAVRQNQEWDLIVLDTPPTSNALDFLQAPERLVSAIDSGAMRWFLESFEGAKKTSLGLVGRGTGALLRGLSRFTGVDFLRQIAEFVTGLNDLFGGFRQRAEEVAKTLRTDEVTFVLVTSPAPLAVREAIFFEEKLRHAGMRRGGVVINGVHALLREPNASDEQLKGELQRLLHPADSADRALRKMKQSLDDERVRGVADRIQTEWLRAQIGTDVCYVEVPAFEKDVHDLGALSRVSDYLSGARVLGA
ncbi:MAG: ArsA-related P-loop ATPase [Myxococcota bacterium]